MLSTAPSAGGADAVRAHGTDPRSERQDAVNKKR
jgi:hypothetical protein